MTDGGWLRNRQKLIGRNRRGFVDIERSIGRAPALSKFTSLMSCPI